MNWELQYEKFTNIFYEKADSLLVHHPSLYVSHDLLHSSWTILLQFPIVIASTRNNYGKVSQVEDF